MCRTFRTCSHAPHPILHAATMDSGAPQVVVASFIYGQVACVRTHIYVAIANHSVGMQPVQM